MKLMNWVAALLLSVPMLAWAASVNINTADEKTLSAELVGIGEAKAADIVADRKANGPFKSPEDLMRVKGVGEATFEKNKDKITVK